LLGIVVNALCFVMFIEPNNTNKNTYFYLTIKVRMYKISEKEYAGNPAGMKHLTLI